MSLSESELVRKTKRTRKREFFDEMNLIVPWAEQVALITLSNLWEVRKQILNMVRG